MYKLTTASKALPAEAGSVSTDPIAIGEDGGDFVINHEFVLSAPVLTGTELPAAETVIYAVQCDDNDDFSSPTTLIPEILVQTGAASTGGAAAATAKFRLPKDTEQYVRVTATTSTTAGDCKAKSMSLTFYV